MYSAMIKISAIVCTYNREKYLGKALESLAAQTLSPGFFEVVIINNNSTDNTERICSAFHEKYSNIPYKYFIETNQGLSYARNRGIKESAAALVTFIDDDAWLDKNFLKEVVGFMESRKEAVSVGGTILLDYEDKEPVWQTKYLASLFGYFKYSYKTEAFRKTDYPRGSNMTFRKTIFEQIGDFNTELGRIGLNLSGGEEKDIYQRIYAKNLPVYNLPNAIVYHAVPVSRTKIEFVKRQATGVGISEWQRVKGSIKMIIGRYFQELFKWMATLVLFVFYCLKFQFAKAIMLVRFRWWVSMGLLKHR
jgi:glycosyltransferase involved in cell wall biosynthesis